MKKLSIREARQSLSHLDRLLAVEKEVMITRRGDPIAIGRTVVNLALPCPYLGSLPYPEFLQRVLDKKRSKKIPVKLCKRMIPPCNQSVRIKT